MTNDINLSESEVWYRCVEQITPIELWLPEDEFEELSHDYAGYLIEVDYKGRERGFFEEDEGGNVSTYLFEEYEVTTHDASAVPDR